MDVRPWRKWIGNLRTLFSFRAVRSKEEARDVLRAIGTIFYLVSILHFIGFAFLRAMMHAYNAIEFLILGCCIYGFQSRIASIVSVLSSSVAISSTIVNMFTGVAGGKNIILALVVFICSLRAVQVSFSYHKIVKSRVSFKNLVIKNVFGFVCFLSLGFVVLLVMGMGMDAQEIESLSDETLRGVLFLVLIVAFGLSYRGWLPFTRNRPFVIQGK